MIKGPFTDWRLKMRSFNSRTNIVYFLFRNAAEIGILRTYNSMYSDYSLKLYEIQEARDV